MPVSLIAPLCTSALVQADYEQDGAKKIEARLKGMPQKYDAKTDNLGNVTVTIGPARPGA